MPKILLNRLSHPIAFHIYKFLIPVLIGIMIYYIPRPLEINDKGWKLLAIFSATIVGLVTKPLPMGGVSFISLTASILFGVLDIKTQAFEGFSAGISWLIVVVFVVARGFIKTRLGDRIGYFFVKLFGKTTLGLSYSLMFTEMVIAPFIPSGIARSGGVIYPILKSITKAVSNANKSYSEKTIGSFLTMICYQSNIISSAVFLTAMAANPIMQSMAANYSINLTWSTWFLAASVPGIVSALLLPILLYTIYPPKLKEMTIIQDLAKAELKKMGPISAHEWIMIGVFFSMLIGWIFGSSYGLDTTTIAFVGLSILMITHVITLDDFISEKEAWHTFLWFGILMVLASNLEGYGVIKFFSNSLASNITHLSTGKAFATLMLVYIYSHYFFASITTHVTAMYSAFLLISISIGVNPLVAALSLAFASSLQGCLTHYGTSSGAIYYATNYIPISTWWKLGFVISLFYIVVWVGIGYFWWPYLGIV